MARSAKRERPQNVATTNDEENRSVIDEAAPAVEDPDVYNFSHRRRGLAVIIDNENFTSTSGMPSRPGSHEDLKSLRNMFNRLKFDLRCYKNLKGADMWKVLTKGIQNNNSLILSFLLPAYFDFIFYFIKCIKEQQTSISCSNAYR